MHNAILHIIYNLYISYTITIVLAGMIWFRKGRMKTDPGFLPQRANIRAYGHQEDTCTNH